MRTASKNKRKKDSCTWLLAERGDWRGRESHRLDGELGQVERRAEQEVLLFDFFVIVGDVGERSVDDGQLGETIDRFYAGLALGRIQTTTVTALVGRCRFAAVFVVHCSIHESIQLLVKRHNYKYNLITKSRLMRMTIFFFACAGFLFRKIRRQVSSK